MSTTYTVTIPSISTTAFCTIVYNGNGVDADYTDYNRNTGTLEDFSWNGTFTIETQTGGSFTGGDYTFSGGTARKEGGYHGHVSVPGDSQHPPMPQDPGKDWVATGT
jgi:hypothetical protein